MAPRSDETAFVVPADDAALDIQNDKIELQEAPEAQAREQTQKSVEEQGPTTVDPFVSGTANFCSNLFGTLLGRTKVCEHCKQKILNSESRVKEMAGETKICFHTECKSARVAIEEKQKALHKDLAMFFEIKERMAQKAETERQAAVQSSPNAGTTRGIKSTLPAPHARKEGFFAKLFGGCRSTRAVL